MPVTPERIAVALGVPAPESGSIQEQQWLMWIEDAVMLIDRRKVEVRFDGQIDEARVDYVVREAVVKHVRKPDDATQVTVSTDDSSSSKTYQSGKGRVTIVDEWWSLLGLVEQHGAFSIDMLPNGSTGHHLPWCSFHFGHFACSCGAAIAGKAIYEVGYE